MPESLAAAANAHDRTAGILIPVFAIRTENDLGIGDVAGLRQFIDWAAQNGYGFVQLLPVNETGPDNSPYNCISSVALEPLTLDCSPEALPGLPVADYWKLLTDHRIDSLRRGDRVEYDKVRALKLELLWRGFIAFIDKHYGKGTEEDEAFHVFCESEAKWLGDYCLFRLLMDMEDGSHVWQKWPETYNTIEKARAHVDGLLDAELEKTERQLVHYAWVQWTAHRQWRAVRAHADEKGVKLMGDIPFGVSACSADVFANPEIFDLDWYGGAPPEKLFKDDPFVQKWGQNWGIPLYRWEVLEGRGYDWWRQRVQKVAEVFSMFRIDHALGFYRIYSFPWNPVRNDEFFPLTEEEAAARCEGRRPGFRPRPDDTDENKAANRAEGEKYLTMIRDAAPGTVVIAEDLGMVPDYVRPSLDSLGIAGMKVPQWEFENGEVVPPAKFPALSFATYATHDHFPMRAQWEQARRSLGDADGGAEARQFLDTLCRFAGIESSGDPPAFSDEVRENLLKALFSSPSSHAGVMISDLLGTVDRINVPGVLDGSNWSYRLSQTVMELVRNPHWTSLTSRVKKLLIETGRAAE